jgi:hypothetical protein
MARGFVYLAVVLDWATRRVLSWRLSITIEAAFCVETLEDARCSRAGESGGNPTPVNPVARLRAHGRAPFERRPTKPPEFEATYRPDSMAAAERGFEMVPRRARKGLRGGQNPSDRSSLLWSSGAGERQIWAT